MRLIFMGIKNKILDIEPLLRASFVCATIIPIDFLRNLFFSIMVGQLLLLWDWELVYNFKFLGRVMVFSLVDWVLGSPLVISLWSRVGRLLLIRNWETIFFMESLYDVFSSGQGSSGGGIWISCGICHFRVLNWT